MNEKAFGLVIWVDDVPITGNIVSLSNITKPRKEMAEYAENEVVECKCPGLPGTHPAVLAVIGGNRSQDSDLDAKDVISYPNNGKGESDKKKMANVLKGPGFEQMVTKALQKIGRVTGKDTTVGDQTCAPSSQKECKSNADDKMVPWITACDDEATLVPLSDTDNSDVEKTPPAKRLKMGEGNSDATKAKKDSNRRKREVERARNQTNTQISMAIVEDVPLTIPPSAPVTRADMAEILDKLTNLTQSSQNLAQDVQELRQEVHQLVSCKQCVKNIYKSFRPENNHAVMIGTPNAGLVKALDVPDMCSPPRRAAEQLPAAEPELVADDGDDLAYLGDAKYGIRVNREKLAMAEKASNKIDKLALNLLELLVTDAECVTLSVYGQAKGKEAMEANKRKALRSHIFKAYGSGMTEDAREQMWMKEIVRKINDKIRAIKNGKYKIKFL